MGIDNKLHICSMAAHVAEPETKSKQENEDNDSNTSVALVATKILQPIAEIKEDNEFENICAMFKSGKQIVSDAIGCDMISKEKISLVNNAIYLDYRGYKYRIEYGDADYDDDIPQMEIGM